MRTLFWMAVVTVIGGACKGEPFLPDAKIDSNVDAFQPEWLTPRKGAYSNWDIQLQAPFDLSAQRDMYMLDLWAVAPASTITYSDSSTISVPAGPLAGMIDTLHGRQTKVACYLRAGAVRLTADPDAMKFPGYEANPPDDPTPPAAGSVIGWRVTSGAADERYLDVREQSRDAFHEIIKKRIEFASTIGCDMVVLDRNDRYARRTGWGGSENPDFIDGADELSWHKQGAIDAHSFTLGVGTKDSYLRGFLTELAGTDIGPDRYDFGVSLRCAEFDECANFRPYLNLFKAVYAIEVKFPDSNDEGVNPETGCTRHSDAGILDGLIKNEIFDGAYAEPCTP